MSAIDTLAERGLTDLPVVGNILVPERTKDSELPIMVTDMRSPFSAEFAPELHAATSGKRIYTHPKNVERVREYLAGLR